MKFPTYKEMAEKVAEQALDEYVINGKTLREWIKLLSEQEPCDDVVSREAVIEMAYDMSEIDGEHFSEPFMVVDVEDIRKLPSVTHKSETVTEFADRCRECGARYGKLLKLCEDCISRQAVLDIINFEDKWLLDAKGHNANTEIAFSGMKSRVSNLPSVRPQEPNALQFAEWVAREIFDDMWEYNKDAFAEIACRKLAKLGIVVRMGDEWVLVEPQERSDKE